MYIKNRMQTNILVIIMILFSHMGMDIDTAKQIMIHDDKLWMYTSCMKKDQDIEG